MNAFETKVQKSESFSIHRLEKLGGVNKLFASSWYIRTLVSCTF